MDAIVSAVNMFNDTDRVSELDRAIAGVCFEAAALGNGTVLNSIDTRNLPANLQHFNNRLHVVSQRANMAVKQGVRSV